MCNLYSSRAGSNQIEMMLKPAFARVTAHGSNLEPMSAVFPDYAAPIVRRAADGGMEIVRARWGMPTPAFALKTRKTDAGVTNVRRTESAHWRRWLKQPNRCLVPFTSFSEMEALPDGKKAPAWFAFDESRPLAFFAGIWTNWTSVRKLAEGQVTADLYAFLTCDPNKEVGAIHPKAMPVILTKPDEWKIWIEADAMEALKLQRPLPDDALQVVARGAKKDPVEAAA